jgi:hypothetical protein
MFLPVLGGTPDASAQRMAVSDVFGTAFAIGGGMYMTAGHVVEAALSTAMVTLAFPEDQGRGWGMYPVLDHEIFSPCDVAIIRAESPHAVPLPWETPMLTVLTDVMAFGYAYGLDHETHILRLRGFKGYTVAARAFERLPVRPAAYELSFQAPRGLSGAPLLLPDSTAIVGMVIGNSTTEMVVFSQREHVIEEGRETLVERFEAMTLGVAIAASSLMAIEFGLLGGTLAAHVSAARLPTSPLDEL